MKLASYTPQVTSISAGNTAKADYSSAIQAARNAGNLSAQAAKSSALDFSPIIKGLGTMEKTVEFIQEQQDNETIIRAVDAYNKSKFENMYNDENGVMNTQADGAVNAVNDYSSNEKKYRQDILGSVKLHSRAKQVALDRMLNDSAQQGYQQVAKHQYQQGEKAKDIKLDSGIQTLTAFAQKNYNNTEMMASLLNQGDILVGARYQGVANSEALIEQARRKALGYIVGSAIDSAMQNEDYTTAKTYADKWGMFLTPAQRANAGKVIYAKGKSKWESDLIKEGMAVCGKDPAKFKEWIKNKKGFSIGNSSGDFESALPYLAKATRMQESSENYNEGNTYYNDIFGAYQFSKGTYKRYAEQIGIDPNDHSKEAQDKVYEAYARDIGGKYGIEAAIVAHYAGVANAERWAKGMPTAINDEGKEYSWDAKQVGGPSVRGYLQEVLEKMKDEGYTGVAGNEQGISTLDQDRLVKQFMTEINTEKRIKNMADDQRNDEFFSEVYQWSTEGKMTMEQALAEARKRSGGDKDLMKDYISTVHLCYNKANGGPGGTGSGKGAGKAAPTYLIDQSKTLLRNGTFKSQNEYVDYVGNTLGGNLNQVWKAREDYNDFKNSAGEFKFDLGNMVNGALTDKYSGKDKLTGTQKAIVAAGVRMYVGKKIAEFRMKNNRDPEMTEVGPMIDEALTTNTYTYQTPGKYFSAWLTDNEFNLSAAELQAMGIDAIEKAPGQNDWYIIRKTNGKIIQTNGATLESMRNKG